MQTQNHVNYMHFLGFEGISAKVRARAGQNALILNLTSEMNFLCQITYKSTSNMLICGKMTHNVTVGF